MSKLDLVLLTESQFEDPIEKDPFTRNVLLEDEILTNAFKKRGLTVKRVDWTRKDFNWSEVSAILVRSTWDYHDKWIEFHEFLLRMKDHVRFINPVETLLWSMDKHYLLDLEKNKVHIVNSLIIEKGSDISLAEASKEIKKDEIILKPCISAGARHTYRIQREELLKYESIFRKLISEEAMILQEFQQNIVDKGELSLMYFGGVYSHAVLKKAKEGDFRVQDDFGGSVHDHNASQEEIDFGLHTIKQVSPMPIYARVDLCIDNSGKLALIELELIEPELWFRNAEKSADLLADAILS